MSDTDRLRAAASDPDAPWYGSDLVPLVADAADEIDRLRAELAERERIAQEGHPTPCNLGPLCPYCEIDRLRARLVNAIYDRDVAAKARIDVGVALRNLRARLADMERERDEAREAAGHPDETTRDYYRAQGLLLFRADATPQEVAEVDAGLNEASPTWLLGWYAGRLREARADLTECLCGCPLADHESYDEDGIACGCDGHECLPVWPTVAVTLRSLRARLAVAERVIEDLATDAHGSRAARALAEWEAGKA